MRLAVAAFLLLSGMVFVAPAFAEPEEMAAGCHCFRARAYDPASKFTADSYLRTTVMNGLLAARYRIGKRDIVMSRMQDGASADDLLLALHLGEAVEGGWQTLLAERRRGVAWSELASRSTTAVSEGNGASSALAAQLAAGLPPAVIARLVVDNLLRRQFPAEAGHLPHYRGQGLQERDLAVLLLLQREGGPSLAELVDRFLQQGQSLAELADCQGLTPAVLGRRAAGE